MIVKILSRHSPSFSSLIAYILQDGKEVESKPEIFTHNLRGTTKEEWVREFLENEAGRKNRRSDQSYLYHEIVSIAVKDSNKVTDTMLADLAKKYISLRGNNGIYLAGTHKDKEHIHIHYCVSGVEYRTGKGFRLSKQELHTLKVRFQEYHKQKYPELENSLPEHGKGKGYVTDREWQARHRDERTLHKDEIQKAVKECFHTSKTQKEFLESLRENNLHYYERNGIPTGIIHEEMKIRFSRLNIPFAHLDIDKSEEQQALTDIQRIRATNKVHSKEFEHDI